MLHYALGRSTFSVRQNPKLNTKFDNSRSGSTKGIFAESGLKEISCKTCYNSTFLKKFYFSFNFENFKNCLLNV